MCRLRAEPDVTRWRVLRMLDRGAATNRKQRTGSACIPTRSGSGATTPTLTRSSTSSPTPSCSCRMSTMATGSTTSSPLAYAAVLGWSPVTRKLLGRKHRSNPQADLAEDRGRAIVIEEGIVAMVFAYATSHDYLRGVSRLDFQLLDVIASLITPVEVRTRTAADWELAILTGFSAWRQLRERNGGVVILNADERSLTIEDADG